MNQVKRSFRFKLIPVLVLLACAVLVAKVADLVVAIKSPHGVEHSVVSAAMAEDDAAPSMDSGMDSASIEPQADEVSSKWRDASDTDLDFSRSRMTVVGELAERRQELEAMAQELEQKKSLLDAAEKQIDQKHSELLALQKELKTLLGQQSEGEAERIRSLVKIYEGMKPKDAARIFNTLDTEVLLQVLGRMSERKSAPIIAAMNDDRARLVTILLAEQKQLPEQPR